MFQGADNDKKLENIKQIAFKRLNQPDGSSYKLFEQCANILTKLMNNYGFDRECYQRFTKNLDRLEEVEQAFSSVINRTWSLTAANEWNDGVLFNKDCIFCNKMDKIKFRVKGVWTMEGLSYFEFGGGGNIQEIQ